MNRNFITEQEAENKWNILLYLSKSICRTTYQNLCKLNKTQKFVVISLLNGWRDSQTATTFHLTECSVRQAVRGIGIKLEIIEDDERNSNIRVLIVKKLSFFLALEHYPRAKDLINQLMMEQQEILYESLSIDFYGEYGWDEEDYDLNQYILTALLLLKQLSTKNRVRIQSINNE